MGVVSSCFTALRVPKFAEIATGGSPADFGCEIDFEHVETELNRRMLSYNRGILKALV